MSPAGRHDLEQPSLPGGTVTFLFTDIEGSTLLLRELRGDYGAALAEHARILRDAFARHGGREVDTQGDSFFAAFPRARDAFAAAADVQRNLAAATWPQGAQVRVRIGVHTGEPERTAERYIGIDVHRAARICAAGHGGQIVCSRIAAGLVGDQLPAGAVLRALGQTLLKDMDGPEELFELALADLPGNHPPLRGADDPEGSAAILADDVASAMTAPVEGIDVGVLGPVEARRDGQAVTIGAAKQRMILAALALRLGEVVSADALIYTLWGDRPPATATKALQVYVSELRKAIDPGRGMHGVIASHPPGYRLGLPSERTDLGRFEQLWRDGREALANGQADEAARALRDALGLWRGVPLADLQYEDAFSTEVRRLEDLRAACAEDRIDAELQLGHHHALIPELEQLVAQNPLRERLPGQLMMALYRAGRQADALAVYGRLRERLVDELGIDPSPALAMLERRILQQDPSLELTPAEPAGTPGAALGGPARTLVCVCQASRELDALTRFARQITEAGQNRDLVLTRVVTTAPGQDDRDRLAEITRRLGDCRDELLAAGVAARVAAFSSRTPAVDIIKLASHQDADLLLLEGTDALLEGRSGLADALLEQAECDVALHLGREDASSGALILVPFSGSEHDWAALELGAMLADGQRRGLAIAGADSGDGRDPSRVLATASLVLQRTTGTVAEPLLIPPGADGVLEAAADAAHVLVGLSPRFRAEGLGQTRYRIARDAPGPVTFVRRGTRPGVLAPTDTMTRFSWSLTSRRS